jgi:transcriptional regulator with GAF, ATPase, and Fis domain
VAEKSESGPTFREEEVGTHVQTFAQQMLKELPPDEERRIVVLEGPDAGMAFPLDPNAPSRLMIGTSPVCGIRLKDPAVSRRHAAIEPVGRRYKVTDLGSTNGTFVDGVAVVEAFLRADELVRVGGTAFRIETVAGTEGKGLTNALTSAVRFGRVYGASTAMRRMYPLLEKLAATKIPVLIEGETGTGKEMVAEAIYEKGGSVGPFVVFDCTTVSPNLVEAELFGHERGAFTGAETTRRGIFEEANGGTLLIDELGDLELPLQAKLLRVLDRGEVRRVGSNNPIQVEVRVLAATRRDLDKAILSGQFRDDLFHRLAVGRVEVPPLRERYGDVSTLVRQFAKEFGIHEIPAATLARFEEYSWPGNVRELRNAVARFAALGEGSLQLLRDDPRPQLGSSSGFGSAGSFQAAAPGGRYDELFQLPFAVARRKAQDDFDREYVERVLQKHNGSVTQAARASGVALRYFRLVKARSRR